MVQLHRTWQTNLSTSIEEAADASVDDGPLPKSPEIWCALELFPRTENNVFFNGSQAPPRYIPAASC